VNARNRKAACIAFLRIAAIALSALPSFAEPTQDEVRDVILPRAGGDGIHWRVRYGSIPLADLALKEQDSSETVNLTLSMVTDRRLPFIPLAYSYRSAIDAESSRPLSFSCRSTRGDDVKTDEYRYDYEAGIVRAARETVKAGKRSADSAELALSPGLFDGINLIGWMMAQRGSGFERRAYFIGDMEAVPLRLVFREGTEWIRLSGQASPIQAYRVDGKLSGPGVAGLTGVFTLWLNADASRLPLKAVIKLWIGEAILEIDPADLQSMTASR
jgi:hypothetical protein